VTARPSVLVVEDERVVAFDLAETLEDLGYDVIAVVSSADEALIAVGVRRPDLALLDICIRGTKDGIEVAEVLRDEFQVPAIFLTAHADVQTVERASRTDPFGYLVKPFEVRALRSALELALRRIRTEASRQRSERWVSAVLGALVEQTESPGPAHWMLLEDVTRGLVFPVRAFGSEGALDEWILRGADGSVQPAREGVTFQVGDRTFRLSRSLSSGSPVGPRCTLRVTINGAAGPYAELRDGTGRCQTWTANNRVVLLYVLARRLEEQREARVADRGWCADAEVAVGVWGRGSGGRSLNVLVTRIRNDLRRAGLDPWMIEKRSGFVRLQGVDVQIVP
jgi:CheY-like chemotaxis protein